MYCSDVICVVRMLLFVLFRCYLCCLDVIYLCCSDVTICVVRLLFVLFGCYYLCCSDVIIFVVRLLFVLFCVLFMCKCVLPPGDNPTAVNKYII
jgi:hypothetical protein